MRIWKLTPTNVAAPVWKIWSPEPIIVRAEDESEAKKLAQLETLKYLLMIGSRNAKAKILYAHHDVVRFF